MKRGRDENGMTLMNSMNSTALVVFSWIKICIKNILIISVSKGLWNYIKALSLPFSPIMASICFILKSTIAKSMSTFKQFNQIFKYYLGVRNSAKHWSYNNELYSEEVLN